MLSKVNGETSKADGHTVTAMTRQGAKKEKRKVRAGGATVSYQALDPIDFQPYDEPGIKTILDSESTKSKH